MKPYKTHLEKNGRSACGKSRPSRNSFVPKWQFGFAVVKCKKCDLIFALDKERS